MTDEQYKQLTDLLRQQIRITSQIGIILTRLSWLLIAILIATAIRIFI